MANNVQNKKKKTILIQTEHSQTIMSYCDQPNILLDIPSHKYDKTEFHMFSQLQFAATNRCDSKECALVFIQCIHAQAVN